MKCFPPLVIAALCTFSHAQVSGGSPVGSEQLCWPEHLSQLPPPPASCVHQGTSQNVREYSEVETTYIENDFIVTLVGECGVWACGQAPPVALGHCGYTESKETCWTVGGSASVEGRTGLLISLFGEVGVTVEINGSFSDCRETGYEAGLDSAIPHCMERDCNVGEQVTTATGTVTEHGEQAHWECAMPSGAIVEVATECSTKQSSGSVNVTRRVRIWFGLPRPQTNCIPCGETC